MAAARQGGARSCIIRRSTPQTTPDKPAYVIAETGETLTYGELDRRSNQGAQLFSRIGLKPGDHIALLMENGLPFVEICWAAQRAGLIYTADQPLSEGRRDRLYRARLRRQGVRDLAGLGGRDAQACADPPARR